jgi:hypothetical protein
MFGDRPSVDCIEKVNLTNMGPILIMFGERPIDDCIEK